MIIAVYFFYGLAFFAMGLLVALESRRNSEIVLSRHLRWLAAFGLTHSAVEWIDMFLVMMPAVPLQNTLSLARTLLLPLSALLLIRFGIGLVSEAGPLSEWLSFVPVIILVPLSLLSAYALVVAFTKPHLDTSTDVWSRYLLYLPGCLLAGFGFMRQWHWLSKAGLSQARELLFGAALAFFFNAIVAGLIVPPAPYGLALWLNYDTVLNFTGVPVQVWRAINACAVAFFVLRAMGVFEVEREQQLNALRAEREQAQAITLSAQRAQRETAENWTNGLVGISRRIANLENVDDVLGATVDLARRLLESDTAALVLLDSTRTKLELKCFATAQGFQNRNLPVITSPIVVNAVHANTPSRFPEDAPDSTEWFCPVLNQMIRAAAIVPLHLENQVIGGLWVGRLHPDSFTETDMVGLERLADQAVIALEYAVMTARLQSLAVTEERSRIAREMHDGLLQILGYLGLQVQTIEALMRQGKRDAVLAELQKTRESICAAQADVRENVLSLRTTLAGDAGLIDSLKEYIAEFQVQTSMQVEFFSSVQSIPQLSPLAEAQLVRIIQEALANVRKHAHATHVQVRLSERNHTIRMSVTDDGIGFKPGNLKNHFGLQTMRERAESIHGVLTVNSELGIGTQVELTLPLLEN
jgi:signal transduction histidine kinase